MKLSSIAIFYFVLISLAGLSTHAQDSLRYSRDSLTGQDTNRLARDSFRVRRGGMSSLFADSSNLNSSDYQLQIEKTYVILSAIDTKSELGLGIRNIEANLADTDSVLAVLRDNILNNTSALNLRNLQVFRTLLQNTQQDLRRHRALLDSTDKNLTALKTNMRALIADTVLRQLLRDSAMRQQFAPQLRIMREEWRASTRHLRQSLANVNLLQTRNSSNSITTNQLLERVNTLLSTSVSRIISKETNYLWERRDTALSNNDRSSFERAFDGERKALHYYFKDSGYNRLMLLLIGILFFLWTYRNLRSLRKSGEITDIAYLGFEYLPANYIVSSFVIMFSIAPLFDLSAPAAYIETMQFLLMITLTVFFWKKWPGKICRYWIAIALLYICSSFTHHMVEPNFWQRSWLILLNILAAFFGVRLMVKMPHHLPLKSFLRFVIILHLAMNGLALLCNIFGRISLAQILGNSAIFAFTQAIGLAIFSKICIEAILLQMAASRLRRGVTAPFEHQQVLQSFKRPVLLLVVLLWMIVYTTNLNIYTVVAATLSEFLRIPRHLGNAYFTIGGVMLFFLIIYIAHLLQRYVGYFFGDTGTEEDVQNKGQRSRLLIARLVVLCMGYLLAVTASGIPVDKITIVLGALGVGIGLGLQNIVSNFASGIILIFDRPLQIGDLVEIGDKSGRVREIGLRSSTLLTKDGAEIIIPNGDILSRQIVNWTLSNNLQRLEIALSVAGSDDMEKVSSSIKKTILLSKYVFESREPQILFTKVNENGFEVKAYFWSADVFKSDEARSEILLLLHQKLKEDNLEIK